MMDCFVAADHVIDCERHGLVQSRNIFKTQIGHHAHRA